MAKVKYEVLKPCFVAGSYFEPGKKTPVIVEADPGLAGPALKLVEDAPPLSLPLADDAKAGAAPAPTPAPVTPSPDKPSGKK